MSLRTLGAGMRFRSLASVQWFGVPFWKGKSTKKIDDVISEYMKRIKEMKPAIIRHLLTDHSPEQLAEKLWEQVHWNLRRAMAEVEE